MTVPTMVGTIDRRILVNYRVDPEIARRILPAPFSPTIAAGWAMAGVCLIRLTELRPKGFPRWMGITSENAAHRFAVEWDDGRGHGVFIPRRDSSSLLTTIVGGRVFPGQHHVARFDVDETGDEFSISLRSRDGETHVSLEASFAEALSPGSMFDDLEEASEFYRRDPLGYSATRDPGCFDGLELRTSKWQVRPLNVRHIASSYFDDTTVFPSGSIVFDCALLMQGIPAVWRARPRLIGASFIGSREVVPAGLEPASPR